MITFHMGDEEKGRDNPTVMVIGLSHKNLKLLKKGRPIIVEGERLPANMGVEKILIFSGTTEQAMAKEIKDWAEKGGINVGADRHGWPGDPQA